jgi:type IV secretion system protein VirB6
MIGVRCEAPAGGGLVTGILDFVDCQAEAIGIGGYQAMAAPGATLSTVMSVLLTLFIALYGYRLILGERLGLRDGVVAFLKIGIVFTLAFNWSAYRTLIYDVAVKGPSELAATIGQSAGLPVAGGGLAARLDGADQSLIALNALGTGGGKTAPGSTLQAAPDVPQASASFDPLALGAARIAFLLGALTGFVGLRLVSALLLAVGPLFIAFLLFGATRGLFEGWIRVLAGAAFGLIGVAMVLGVELALIEPRLVELVNWRTAGYATPGAAVEVLVIAMVFAIATAILALAAWRLTGAFALPALWRSAVAEVGDRIREGAPREISAPVVTIDGVGRATAIANSVSVTQQRESSSSWAMGNSDRSALPHQSRIDERGQLQPLPLGQSGRRTRARSSAGALRRDLA